MIFDGPERNTKKVVIILGGGVAGLSAAHELAKFRDRFEVHVFEATSSFGGKAASQNATNLPNAEGKAVYAAEHGFRLFPHFYRHVTQTMKEIPFVPEGKHRLPNPDGNVWGNLRGCTEAGYAANGHLHRVQRPLPARGVDFLRVVRDLLGDDQVASEADVALYSWMVLKYLTSCSERRDEEYDKMTWLEFLGAQHGWYSKSFEKLIRTVPRSLSAMRDDIGSARSIGNSTLQVLFDFAGDGGLHMESVLTGPTQEMWIQPWYTHLQKAGVNFWRGAQLIGFDFDGLRVTGAQLKIAKDSTDLAPLKKWCGDTAHELHLVEAAYAPDPAKYTQCTVSGKALADSRTDYFIGALPLEAMQETLGLAPRASRAGHRRANSPHQRMIAFDESLARMLKIERGVSPMVGIQFYLMDDVPICNGHVFYPNSPWALTSISQAQFWETQLKNPTSVAAPGKRPNRPTRMSDYLGADHPAKIQGRYEAFEPPVRIRGLVSVIISDWRAKAPARPEIGLYEPKAASELTEEEIKREVWSQLKDALNTPGKPPVLDDWNLWQGDGTIPEPETYDKDYTAWLNAVLRRAAHLDRNVVPRPPESRLPTLTDEARAGLSEAERATRAKAEEAERREGLRLIVNPFDGDGKVRPETTPLFVHPKGSLALRPDAQLRIPNLLLAADYVRTFTDLATMEGANEAARRAVLAILRREVPESENFPKLWPLQEGQLFAAAQSADRILYKMGKQPHIMDTPKLLSFLLGSVFDNLAQSGKALLGLAPKASPDMARRPVGSISSVAAIFNALGSGSVVKRVLDSIM